VTVANLSTWLGIVAAVVGSVVIPLYLNRHAEKRRDAKAAAKDADELAKGTDVSWEKINLAIVRERDRLAEDLAEQATAHRAEIDTMRTRHAEEISTLRTRWEHDASEMRTALDREASEMKQRYDEEMSSLSTRLAECQKQVSRLYGELYELQKLLPPGIARPWPGPGQAT
jgi:Skp family chaperone for outer membrane proteins